MAKVPQSDYIGFLLARKYPAFKTLLQTATDREGTIFVGSEVPSKSSLIDTDKSDDEGSSSESGKPKVAFARFMNEIKNYRASLESLTVEELDALYREEHEKQCEEDDLKRFFNKKAASADFDYWTKMAHWTLDEAVALATLSEETRLRQFEYPDSLLR